MISPFGVDHGDFSKAYLGWAREIAGPLKAAGNAQKYGTKAVARGKKIQRDLTPYASKAKMRTGQVRRNGDSRVDHPNQMRGYVSPKGKTSTAWVPPYRYGNHLPK